MIELNRNETLSLVFEYLVKIRELVENCEGSPGHRRPKDFAAELKRISEHARRACVIIEDHEKPGAASSLGVPAGNDADDLLGFLRGRGRALIERAVFAAEGAQEVLGRIDAVTAAEGRE